MELELELDPSELAPAKQAAYSVSQEDLTVGPVMVPAITAALISEAAVILPALVKAWSTLCLSSQPDLELESDESSIIIIIIIGSIPPAPPAPPIPPLIIMSGSMSFMEEESSPIIIIIIIGSMPPAAPPAPPIPPIIMSGSISDIPPEPPVSHLMKS